jgi:hypothetical protein
MSYYDGFKIKSTSYLTPLIHLFLPKLLWSESISNLQKTNFQHTNIGYEAKTRFGDFYSESPSYCNVLEEIYAFVGQSNATSTSVDSNKDSKKETLDFPKQSTTLRFTSANRFMDVKMSIQPPEHSQQVAPTATSDPVTGLATTSNTPTKSTGSTAPVATKPASSAAPAVLKGAELVPGKGYTILISCSCACCSPNHAVFRLSLYR